MRPSRRGQYFPPCETARSLAELGAGIGLDAYAVRRETVGQQKSTFYLLKILEGKSHSLRIGVGGEIGPVDRHELVGARAADAELDLSARDLARLEILGQGDGKIEQAGIVARRDQAQRLHAEAFALGVGAGQATVEGEV